MKIKRSYKTIAMMLTIAIIFLSVSTFSSRMYAIDEIENDSTVMTNSSSISSTIIPDGVYALQNVGNEGYWMNIQQNQTNPGYHVQQYAYTTSPAASFNRASLFKISKHESYEDCYIIRLMLNNNLSLGFSNDEVLTTSLSGISDIILGPDMCFTITYDSGGYIIKPYNSDYAICAPNSTASGSAGAPDSYLEKGTVSANGDRARWELYPYTGADAWGYVFDPALPSQLEANHSYVTTLKTWSTKIAANKPFASMPYEYSTWVTFGIDTDGITCRITPHNSGTFNIQIGTYINADTIVSDSTLASFAVVPHTNKLYYFIKNVATNKYIDIEGPSKSNGAIIQQWQFNGKPQSKWEFIYGNDGYMRIKSVYSGLYIGVDSTDITKVKQYSSENDYTLWKSEMTTLSHSKLICKATQNSGYVLAVPNSSTVNGKDLAMITYTDNSVFNDEWDLVFSPQACVLTYNVNPYWYDDAQVACDDFTSMGYTSFYNLESQSGVLNENILGSDILWVAAHGSQHAIRISPNIYLNDGHGNYVTVNSNVGTYNWYDTKLVVYLACETASTSENNLMNLCQATYDAGADCVIGWGESIYIDDMIVWQELFLNCLKQGMTISEAVSVTMEHSFDMNDQAMESIHVYGDDSVVLNIDALNVNTASLSTANSANLLASDTTQTAVYNNLNIDMVTYSDDFIMNVLKATVENFVDAEYIITKSAINESKNDYIINLKHVHNGFVSKNGYVLVVEDDKVIRIRDNMEPATEQNAVFNQGNDVPTITEADVAQATQEAIEKIVPADGNASIVNQKVEKYYDADTDTYYLKVLIKYEIDGVFGANGYLYKLNNTTN